MKKTYWIMLICVLMLFSGCKKQDETKDTGFKLYYINQDATKLMTQDYTLKGETVKDRVEELMVAMKSMPEDPHMKLAIPEEVGFEGHNFGEAGQLQLCFDENYNLVTGVEEVLMRAAVVKTFSQIDGVNEVEFLVKRIPLTKGDVIVGRMQADDFIDTGEEMMTYSQNAVISIYFSNEKGDKLVETQRKVEYDGSVTLEQVILEQLIDGIDPKEVGMKATLPPDTILNKVTKKDGICNIDFNEALLNNVDGVNPEVTVYSIVNTLVEQPSVDKVQITINGETVDGFKSISLNQMFERNLNIIEGEK